MSDELHAKRERAANNKDCQALSHLWMSSLLLDGTLNQANTLSTVQLAHLIRTSQTLCRLIPHCPWRSDQQVLRIAQSLPYLLLRPWQDTFDLHFLAVHQRFSAKKTRFGNVIHGVEDALSITVGKPGLFRISALFDHLHCLTQRLYLIHGEIIVSLGDMRIL